MNWYRRYKIANIENIPYFKTFPYQEEGSKDHENKRPFAHSTLTYLKEHFKDENRLNKIIEKMFPNAKFLGGGANGVVYDLGNEKVLKITEDSTEAMFASKYRNSQFKHIAQIYDVLLLNKIQKTDNSYPISLWGIVVEKVKPLNDTARKVVGFFKYRRFNFTDLRGKNFFTEEEKYYAKNFYELMQFVRQHGFEEWDIKPSNLGLNKNNDIVILDFGQLEYIPSEFQIS